MLGRSVNVLGSLMIWWTTDAVQMVLRSDRKSYRDRRPTYGQCRKPRSVPRRPAVMLRGGRRCAPRLTTKPAMYRMGGKLLVHPALRPQIERLLNTQ